MNHSTQYAALHAYLSAHYPKAGKCEECGRNGRTHHALIHGREHSRNREDYRELCQRCHCRYDFGGERSRTAKLTRQEVDEIREKYRPARGGTGLKPGSARALAAEYGVSHAAILKIVRGESWATPKEIENRKEAA